ncbi:hypothetical protein V5799_030057 [Amblyomma americanum]|uniref:Uncharacterized protein n=1 Tax=Amblyomma americanum TaxID=6943 RepID=A0AAQ4EPD5_AMBAM
MNTFVTGGGGAPLRFVFLFSGSSVMTVNTDALLKRNLNANSSSEYTSIALTASRSDLAVEGHQEAPRRKVARHGGPLYHRCIYSGSGSGARRGACRLDCRRVRGRWRRGWIAGRRSPINHGRSRG